ncbi:hypothetical protein F503_08288 [Ophiostoma piceae UAMH 11346]|uniref:Uncharacterized protein n=1 Tax=Ophiostoma piceae (strain UAMH 11346) TaxID=1262450 RepID=S3BZ16_OPHP1|nr:hypothetical protein F503_08288 [Ophiostoma piceae UAMH 11346]
MPSNFRTYEAQSRLLAAVIASTPAVKLNFKAIALHYGSDTTASSIDHRFRTIKKQAAIIRRAVAEGTDAKDVKDIFYMNDKDIAKYFGESTPMGIEFQFRTIRKEAKALRDAVDKGESPLSTRRTTASPTVRVPSSDGSARKRKAPAASSGIGASSSTGARAGGIASAQVTPKKRARTVEVILSNEEESLASEVDYDELDVTPVSTPARGQAPALIDLDEVPEARSSYPAIATPSTAFVPDATPGLSVGATPTDESPDAGGDEYHTALRTQRQSQYQHQANAHTFSMSHFQDGDDEDDEVFIIDTPSKAPKMEAARSSMSATMSPAAAPSDIKPLASPQPHISSFATSCNSTVSAMNDYSLGSSSWDTLSQEPSQSQTDFSLDSNDAWTQPDFFHVPESVPSLPQASFYDDDAAI